MIDSFASVGDVEKAQALCVEMETRYKAGNESLKPNMISYSAVLKALSRSKQSGALEEAMAILRKNWNSAAIRSWL